eukprot:g11462.t1
MGNQSAKAGVVVWGQPQDGSGNADGVTPPRLIEQLRHVHVRSIVCGGHHSVALSDNGDVYSWGVNRSGELGHGDPISSASSSSVRGGSRGIGSHHGGAGDPLHAHRGSSSYNDKKANKLGQFVDQYQDAGDLQFQAPKPIRALHNKNIRMVACAEHHTAATSADGVLYTWGKGQNGRLGHGCKQNELSPKPVETLLGHFVTQVSCGDFHTACVTVVRKMNQGAGGQGSSSDQRGSGAASGAGVSAQAGLLQARDTSRVESDSQLSVAMTAVGGAAVGGSKDHMILGAGGKIVAAAGVSSAGDHLQLHHGKKMSGAQLAVNGAGGNTEHRMTGVGTASLEHHDFLHHHGTDFYTTSSGSRGASGGVAPGEHQLTQADLAARGGADPHHLVNKDHLLHHVNYTGVDHAGGDHLRDAVHLAAGAGGSTHGATGGAAGNGGLPNKDNLATSGGQPPVVERTWTIYTWGLGLNGRLGHGDEADRAVPMPVKILGEGRIECGGHHTAFTTATGLIYTWGGGAFGKLGHGNTDCCLEPVLIESLAGSSQHQAYEDQFLVSHSTTSAASGGGGASTTTDHAGQVQKSAAKSKKRFMVQCVLGSQHSVSLSNKGEVYTWGQAGRLGHSLSEMDELAPRVTPARDHEMMNSRVFVVQVSCGHSHCAALSDRGDVWAWGTSRSFGHTDSGCPPNVPTQVRVLSGKAVVSLSLWRDQVVGPRGTTQWEPMNEMVFVSNELKSYQNLALRLTRQLQDAYAKIFDLQSENSFLKSELEVMHHNARQD